MSAASTPPSARTCRCKARRWPGLAACSAAWAFAWCWGLGLVTPVAQAVAADTFVIVAIAESPESLPGAGSTPRADYRRSAGYAGSVQAAAVAAALALDHRLAEQSFWSIAALRWRCMLYRLAPGADREAVLAALALDPRVQLAQPLNQFETLADRRVAETPAAAPYEPLYNDPYVGLQRGFAAMDTAQAQRWTRGGGVRVALIDTAVDASHPDLQGRVFSQRDAAGSERPVTAAERHGTQMAGVIAASANNRIGIVGVAPQAQIMALRACWAADVPAAASHCDSFTLGRALSMAIAGGADVINLSLAGPADPLLQKLADHAMQRGAVVVGAVPPSGRLDGFPVGVPGVLAVAASEDGAAAPGVLTAPGRDVLTLEPGGRYDYASGSSLAAAHVSAAVALLRALEPGLRGPQARALLTGPQTMPGAPVDVCQAVRRLRPAARCGSATAPP